MPSRSRYFQTASPCRGVQRHDRAQVVPLPAEHPQLNVTLPPGRGEDVELALVFVHGQVPDQGPRVNIAPQQEFFQFDPHLALRSGMRGTGAELYRPIFPGRRHIGRHIEPLPITAVELIHAREMRHRGKRIITGRKAHKYARLGRIVEAARPTRGLRGVRPIDTTR